MHAVDNFVCLFSELLSASIFISFPFDWHLHVLYGMIPPGMGEYYLLCCRNQLKLLYCKNNEIFVTYFLIVHLLQGLQVFNDVKTMQMKNEQVWGTSQIWYQSDDIFLRKLLFTSQEESFLVMKTAIS